MRLESIGRWTLRERTRVLGNARDDTHHGRTCTTSHAEGGLRLRSVRQDNRTEVGGRQRQEPSKAKKERGAKQSMHRHWKTEAQCDNLPTAKGVCGRVAAKCFTGRNLWDRSVRHEAT
ncbi:hypothetical protein TRVL_01302 [Trypanosoma vivax]|nr:hypothetical protein TRVL_01302 [Trypanosoma vivax]